MKELLKKSLIEKAADLQKIFMENKAFAEFQNYLNLNQDLKKLFTEKEIEEIFPKPSEFEVNSEQETNEEGDILTSAEWTYSNDDSIHNFDNIGWLNDKILRDKIYSDIFYQNKIRPSIGNMPEEVKKDIELHSTHILGRCNNPNNWENNKQGLVYGMVQSGKTVSMITLMGQARASGYRIFIILAGDKTSLRDQTQKRIDEAFDLNNLGYSRKYNIRSLTNKGSDYSDVSKKIANGLDLWEIKDNQETIIICIKKQTDNLKKLLQHLKEIETSCKPGGRYADITNYDVDFKTMIIDDEADYASQDTRPTRGGATIHNDIVAIREQLKQNCYVAYTATPQACIGADPNKLVGYPTDFIWLLEPHRDEYGETTTYLGLEEFFEKHPNQLIERLPKDAWPYVEKEEGRRMGIYDPTSGELVDAVLTRVEVDYIDNLILDGNARSRNCESYKAAIVDYLLGCSFRWYRHYLKCQKDNFFLKNKPTCNQIEAIEARNRKETLEGYKPFPYHSMMFNLTYITDSQKKIVELVEIFWKEIKDEWLITKKQSWKSETLFTRALERQNEKSYGFGKSTLEVADIEEFLELAIKISEKKIEGNEKFIYLLNSKDEGLTLQYDNQLSEGRPKKASIIVGGNILSRGLTIENLSVTVFARSQVMSLGDTNLQMCRWFGHKKQDIDLQTVYLQEHSQVLFQNISEADKELRRQFKTHIFRSTPMKCLLLSLFNSPLFRNTSPTKSTFLVRGSQASYSGLTIDLLEHIKSPNFEYLKNNGLLNDYLKSLPPSIKRGREFKRANVYRNVPQDEFLKFFNSLHFAEDALNISPTRYISYLQKWKENGSIPDFNIAVFDVNSKGEIRNRARKITGRPIAPADFKTVSELISNAQRALAPFRGGKSDPKGVKKNPELAYCGDNFIDMPKQFHIDNYDKKSLRREKGTSILFIFYMINANYVGKFPHSLKSSKKVMFEIGDSKYISTNEPLITFSIATPSGGPLFRTQINGTISEIVRANSTECEDYL